MYMINGNQSKQPKYVRMTHKNKDKEKKIARREREK